MSVSSRPLWHPWLLWSPCHAGLPARATLYFESNTKIVTLPLMLLLTCCDCVGMLSPGVVLKEKGSRWKGRETVLELSGACGAVGFLLNLSRNLDVHRAGSAVSSCSLPLMRFSLASWLHQLISLCA